MPHVEVLHYTPALPALREYACLVEKSLCDKPPHEIAKIVILRGYTSVLEHFKATFLVIASRVCTHQLVRHRIASYWHQSLRRSAEPVKKVFERLASLGVETENDVNGGNYMEICKALEEWFEIPVCIPSVARLLVHSIRVYRELVDSGVAKEDARYFLPMAVKSKIIVTMNFRELVESFLPLRMCARAQREIRDVAWMLWRELVEREPAVWRYAGPRCLRVYQLAGKAVTVGDLLDLNERCLEGMVVSECVSKLLKQYQFSV